MRKNDNEFVDFSKFQIERKEVSINGKKLPLAIGDKILISEEDRIIKTVMGITINEDNRINYGLEWFDASDNSFKSEWLTLTELKLLNKNSKKRNKIVLNG